MQNPNFTFIINSEGKIANEKKVLTIKNNILEKCTNSKFAVDIEIPDGVTEIAREAFAGRCASG